MTNRLNLHRHIGTTASWTVLGLLLACGSGEALAQTTPPPATAPGSPNNPDTIAQEDAAPTADIVVVGSRQSQQSSNARKKNARTATDSIVADDIGSFPDRNVNEAISRVPGVALSRNEFGEGDGIAIRGNGPDLTRVELNGVGVQSTNALAIGTSSGRGADLRELPAELIKSVDVVKGSTADMTEGSLGGSVSIKTRSGLDFKKPYVSIRAGGQQNSLGKDITPDFNAVASRKFFNNRLGAIVSGTYSKIQNNGHSYENTTSNNRGFARLYDFDNSPEKTFQFNPATVGTDAADVGFANSTRPNGAAGLLTPRELVTLAAGAKTKAECLTIFPNLPAPIANQNTAQNAARSQRILEQQSCLNQWNDATPSLVRNFTSTQTDQRYSIDGRLDFRVTDRLTVYASGTIANRKVHDQQRTRNQLSGNNGIFNSNLNGTFDTSATYPVNRTVSPNAPAGYALFDPQYGLNAITSIIGTPGVNSVRPIYGNVLNVVPGSVVVDKEHNVTGITLTNNTVNIDQIENQIDTQTKYGQIGAEYRGERLEIEGFAGITSASTARGDMRVSRNYNYGNAKLTLQPNGLYNIELPSTYDDANPANFVQIAAPACIGGGTAPTCIGQSAVVATSDTNPVSSPAYTVGQLPRVTPGITLSYTPVLGKSTEKIAKLDLAYKTDEILPFITRIKIGGQYRKNNISVWNNGGYTAQSSSGVFGQPGYVPGIYVPTAIVRSTLRACEPTATSTVPCNYGFVPSVNPQNVRSGVDTLTQQQLIDLFGRTLEPADSAYFGDLPNRGSLPASWNGIRTDELFAALGSSRFVNTDCLITCVGSDGKTYDQPVRRANETIKNAYAMADFEARLPLGLLFNGNVGVRGVFTKVVGTGLQTITAIRVTSNFNPADPANASGIATQSFIQNVSVNRSTTDFLPSVNLNLWAFNEKVVFRAYGGKTVARPNINNIIPGGTCTIDERTILDTGNGEDVFGCSGRVGNPGLKPFTAYNYNLSLEWYPNADTVFSAAFGKLDVKIGNPIAVTLIQQPFAGSTQIDPVTGGPLSEFMFSVPTFANGPGYKRNIYEFSAKTAFTFLPWIFKHTGFDANFSILKSAATAGTFDPETGELQPPPDESKYNTNASIWYDDGKLNVRLTYQKRSERFTAITPGLAGISVDTNYPGEQYGNARLVAPGYNPGVPRYIDGSTFFDGKISYNINRNFQIYLEGRNLRREAQTISTSGYVPFEDGTPKILRLQYGGRRILGGVRFKIGG